jgi:hypothetical protein
MLCRLSAVIVVERAADDPARHGGEMNSPFLNAAGWDAEVTEMIAAFGAPISPSDAKIIGDYLKANYGQ